MERKWYQQTRVIIASLWLFFPAGLYLMWRYASWSKRWKWGITGIAAALVALTALGAALPAEDPLEGLTPEQVVSVHATATQEALAAQEEEARQEKIAAQEEQERAYLEALAEQEEQKAEQVQEYLEALEEAVARQTAEAPEPTETPKPTPEPTVGWSVRAVPGAVAEADDAQVTLNEIVDPWFTNNQFMQPSASRRYVAFDVTIEHTAESGKLYAGGSKFRLLNTEDFAYDNAGFCPVPCLNSIDLGGGQKTRGWVVFEVDESTPLKVLKYDPQTFSTDDIEFYFQ